MQIQPWRLAIVSIIIPLTTACQMTSSGSPTEVKAAVKEAEQDASKLKLEFCRGQIPQPFTPEQYDALTSWGKDYVKGNMRQWQEAGCYA